MPMTRRQWIKTGVAGGTLLAVAGLTTKGTFWGAGSRHPQAVDYKYQFLTVSDRKVLLAIIPVILADSFANQPTPAKDLAEETVRGVDVAISGFYPAVQNELRQLFSLLTLPPGRMLAAGVWSSWPHADHQAIATFLKRWRNSRFDLLKTGYDALQQLVVAAWYGNPKSWEGIHYPGPPKIN